MGRHGGAEEGTVAKVVPLRPERQQGEDSGPDCLLREAAEVLNEVVRKQVSAQNGIPTVQHLLSVAWSQLQDGSS